MPPKQLVDLSQYDLERIEFGPDQIRARNPHRHELELLDAIIAFRPEDGVIIGEHRAKEDAFWVRGHIPGRPLFPGVLMIETAAQLCSFYWKESFPDNPSFFGFGGIGASKFRGQVVPGDRLLIVGKSIDIRPRRARFDVQGFVNGTMVFESQITGMVV